MDLPKKRRERGSAKLGRRPNKGGDRKRHREGAPVSPSRSQRGNPPLGSHLQDDEGGAEPSSGEVSQRKEGGCSPPLGITATQWRAQLQQEKRIRDRLSKSNSKVTKSNSKVNLVEKQNDDLKKNYVQLKEQQAVECHQKRKREEEFTDLESSHAQLSSRFDERCERYSVSTAKQRANMANARKTNKVLKDTLFVEVKAGKDKLTALSVEVKKGKDKLTDLESSHAQLSSRFDERCERYSVSTAK